MSSALTALLCTTGMWLLTTCVGSLSETVFERRGEELYQGEGYEDRVDVPEDHLLKGDCSLELKNVRPEDEGVYESFLLVRRTKRSLRSKRVFLQSVELSVDETPKETVSGKLFVTDDAGLNGPHLQILASSLFLCLVFCFF